MKNIKEFYEIREHELRINFNQNDKELSGLPVVFKINEERYARGHIILINTGRNDSILTYDVDKHNHFYINKSNIFYINYKFLMARKNLIVIALSDVKPIRNNE